MHTSLPNVRFPLSAHFLRFCYLFRCHCFGNEFSEIVRFFISRSSGKIEPFVSKHFILWDSLTSCVVRSNLCLVSRICVNKEVPEELQGYDKERV